VSPQDRGTWEQRGGRIRFDAKGRPVYLIRKQIGGQRYEVSTRRHTLAAALAEWERFERDPDRYHPGGDPATAPIRLDAKLAAAFLGWSEHEKGNTVGWVKRQRSCLTWWAERLGSLDLRRVTVRDHLEPALASARGRRHKIETIKALYGWLRQVKHEITAAEDPTYGALPVPQARPAQYDKSKVIPRDHYLLVREHIVGVWRDALDILAGTGWHVTEFVRFAQAGTIEPLPRAERPDGAAAVLVCPRHKSGDVQRTAISPEVLEAAKRIRERGWTFDSVNPLHDAIAAACDAVKRPDGGTGIPRFTPGRFRHSVATWAIEAGASPAAVAAYLGHRSERTTRRFYATHAVVPKVPTLR
jgi:integrase